jgi:hypothetical protein
MLTIDSNRPALFRACQLSGEAIRPRAGGGFRYVLIATNNARDALIAWAHAWPYIGWRPAGPSS